MLSLVRLIIVDVLETLYQSFWPAFLSAILLMYFYLFTKFGNESNGTLCGSIKIWIEHFRNESFFRKLFILNVVFMMILYRTLLNRNIWLNPLSDVMGGWTIWKVSQDGNVILTTECFENIALMFPFIILLMWTFQEKILRKADFKCTVLKSTEISFLFSLGIEFLQLFLRVGTFQLSDVFYNSLGGFIGGIVYFFLNRANNIRKERR